MNYKLQEFYDLLTENVDFSCYPPPTTRVKGISIICYEGLLMNTTIQIYMYKQNFVGDIQAMEFSGLGCPKATVIHKRMAHVMQLTKY